MAFRKNRGMTYKEHALMKIFLGEICPLSYENKVSLLTDKSMYDAIDKTFYPHVFSDIDWVYGYA